jgi:CRISPR/Cas system-associated endonuclease Cas1
MEKTMLSDDEAAAREAAMKQGIYPYTRLEEDVLRYQIVRKIVELRCRRCTKARCRRARPCRNLREIDDQLAEAQAAAAEERRQRNEAAAAKRE